MIIQQRYDPETKTTWWGEIDPWLTDVLYLHEGFKHYFNKRSGECTDSLYPTVTIRQIMWTLKLKPIPRESNGNRVLIENIFDAMFTISFMKQYGFERRNYYENH